MSRINEWWLLWIVATSAIALVLCIALLWHATRRTSDTEQYDQ
jgi:cytochrome c-type biogenesis protein CcmH/NrfF